MRFDLEVLPQRRYRVVFATDTGFTERVFESEGEMPVRRTARVMFPAWIIQSVERIK